jgi:adenylate kinase family enzyme
MRRALVIGNSGAGKSTFARALACKSALPLIHLDHEFWRPGWDITPRAAWRAKVAELVARDSWIMDGNYYSSLDLRLPRADAVFWFDYPRSICLSRVLWRVATTYGRVRPDMAEGCAERLDLPFLRYVWGFNGAERPGIAAALERYGAHLVPMIFRRDADVRRFLDTLAA